MTINNEPPKMTTPLGLLADAYAQIASLYNHRAADQSTMAEKNAALQKENDAYEALFRVLAETLREYDPKVKSLSYERGFLDIKKFLCYNIYRK